MRDTKRISRPSSKPRGSVGGLSVTLWFCGYNTVVVEPVGGLVQVICSTCSRQCAPLAYRAYRRSRVCDNCDVILSHKARRGLRGMRGMRGNDDASSAAGPPAEYANVCLPAIDEEILGRNNQPLCYDVSSLFCHCRNRKQKT